MKKPLSLLVLACPILVCIGMALSCNKMIQTPPPGSGDSTHVPTDSTHMPTDSATSNTTADLKRGLLLYLPFNGSFSDSSGNGNVVSTVNGVSLTTDEHGYTNSALAGNGNGQLLIVTNNGSIQFDTAFTLSFHFMTKNPDTRQVFAAMVDYSTGHGPVFEAGLGTTADSIAIHDYLNMAVVDSATGCSNWGTSNESFEAKTTWKPLQYAWYEFTGVFNKGKTDIYINGQLISSSMGALYRSNFCSSDKIVIGGWWTVDPASFNGKMDDVRLYGRALNAKEINKLARGFHQ